MRREGGEVGEKERRVERSSASSSFFPSPLDCWKEGVRRGEIPESTAF